MMLMDVNVLLYALNDETTDHQRYSDWLNGVMGSAARFAMAESVLSSVVRVATLPKAFAKPLSTEEAFRFVNEIRSRDNCVIVSPGPRHWDIFTDLCRQTRARGNTVPDAYLAAMAIESDCEWVTADRGFGQFPGLRWRHPLHA